MPESEDLEKIKQQWNKALDSKNWERALDAAVNGYRIATCSNDHIDTLMFLSFIRIAAENLFKSKSRRKTPEKLNAHACSFCTKSGKDIKLVAGMDNIAICADCARIANKQLNN